MSVANDDYFSGIKDNEEIPFINSFLDKLKQEDGLPKNSLSALDCAAGSGRITDLILKDRFQAVDLFEMNPEFVEVSKKRLRGTSARTF